MAAPRLDAAKVISVKLVAANIMSIGKAMASSYAIHIALSRYRWIAGALP
jgi:hypothetical protein